MPGVRGAGIAAPAVCRCARGARVSEPCLHIEWMCTLRHTTPPPPRIRSSSSAPAPAPHSQHCRSLRSLHLELPPPQVPLAAAAEAVARAAAGEQWGGPAPAEGPECPPVDGFLLKLLAQVGMCLAQVWPTSRRMRAATPHAVQCLPLPCRCMAADALPCRALPACLPKGSACRGRGGMGAIQAGCLLSLRRAVLPGPSLGPPHQCDQQCHHEPAGKPSSWHGAKSGGQR